MKLYIPALGDHLRLTAPWAFKLYNEYRNEALYKHLGLEQPMYRYGQLTGTLVSLPAGTELGIDRIYIRRGNKEFDSITLNLLGVKGRGRVRFWVKLRDANMIEFESLSTNLQLDEDEQ
jgi:hypothetical protein